MAPAAMLLWPITSAAIRNELLWCCSWAGKIRLLRISQQETVELSPRYEWISRAPYLSLRVVAHHEPHRLAAVEDVAAQPDDAVDQLDALADLRGLLGAGVDRQVLELVGALDVAARADLDVLEDPRSS